MGWWSLDVDSDNWFWLTQVWTLNICQCLGHWVLTYLRLKRIRIRERMKQVMKLRIPSWVKIIGFCWNSFADNSLIITWSKTWGNIWKKFLWENIFKQDSLQHPRFYLWIILIVDQWFCNSCGSTYSNKKNSNTHVVIHGAF